MRIGAKLLSVLAASMVFVLTLCLWLAPAALAASAYEIQDNATGGECTQIGTWDNASKTCTLNQDLSLALASSDLGIYITSDDITLDGAGHSITLTSARVSQRGVFVSGQDSVTVKHLTINGFDEGIYLSSCTYGDVIGNRLGSNISGIYVAGGHHNKISINNMESNTLYGLRLTSTSSNEVKTNDFISNSTQVFVSGGAANSYSYGNYFNDYDSRAEGCVNNAPFNYSCDTAYSFAGGSSPAYVLSGLYDRIDWTWYDDVGGDNWVLLVNNPGNPFDILFHLEIDNSERPLTSIPGYSAGYVPPGSTIFNKYAGLVGGPVTVKKIEPNTRPTATSQRILWPKGGNSLEEVNGTHAAGYYSRLYWTWYDMASPGFKNWVLISNLNNYQINYNIKIAGTVVDTGTIPANGRVTPTFPGMIGGPVEANAWDSYGDPVYIMGSQRVLSNNDTAFNEQPGLSARTLNSEYVWTWYDQVSPGAKNWVLVANPPDAAGPIYYEVWIAGTKVKDGGPIPPGGNETPTFPGTIGGPVEVKSFSDAGHNTAAASIASQRIIWGPSFGEVLGGNSNIVHTWTWYDQASAGAKNWVLVGNPPDAPGPIYYEVWVAGNKVKDGGPIPPGGNETPTFPGTIGGPVVVKSYSNAAHTSSASSIASQRVLWNGYFNENWGQ
jgi:parallel beta-helix repeat protein